MCKNIHVIPCRDLKIYNFYHFYCTCTRKFINLTNSYSSYRIRKDITLFYSLFLQSLHLQNHKPFTITYKVRIKGFLLEYYIQVRTEDFKISHWFTKIWIIISLLNFYNNIKDCSIRFLSVSLCILFRNLSNFSCVVARR